MKKSLFLLSLFFLLSSNPSVADDDDRYRAVVLQRGGGSADNQGKVFIIDSEKGHMWMWEDKSKFTTNDGKMAFGTKITYQGKLKPGKEIGEIIGHGIGR